MIDKKNVNFSKQFMKMYTNFTKSKSNKSINLKLCFSTCKQAKISHLKSVVLDPH